MNVYYSSYSHSECYFLILSFVTDRARFSALVWSYLWKSLSSPSHRKAEQVERAPLILIGRARLEPMKSRSVIGQSEIEKKKIERHFWTLTAEERLIPLDITIASFPDFEFFLKREFRVLFWLDPPELSFRALERRRASLLSSTLPDGVLLFQGIATFL